MARPNEEQQQWEKSQIEFFNQLQYDRGFAAGVAAAAKYMDDYKSRGYSNEHHAARIRTLRPPAAPAGAQAGGGHGQLFVVHNPKANAVYVFNNHDAALRCRTDLKLDHWHLWGQVVSSDWKDGEAIRALRPPAAPAESEDRCANCGYPRREHSYNGACYGLCGEFVRHKMNAWQMVAGEGARLKRDQLEREIGKLPQPHAANLGHTFSKLFMFLEDDLERALRIAANNPYIDYGNE